MSSLDLLSCSDLAKGSQAFVEFFARHGLALSPAQQQIAERAFEFSVTSLSLTPLSLIPAQQELNLSTPFL